VVTGTVTPVSCNGGANGSITTSVSGGTPPIVSYAWTWTVLHTASTPNLSSLAGSTGAGKIYKVTVTDANGCQAINVPFAITEPPALTPPTHTMNPVSCNTASAVPPLTSDGSISITPGGGTPPYTYSWSNGETTNPATLLSVAGGPYIVTVKDANGCTKTSSSWNVSQPAVIHAAATVMHTAPVGSSHGSITLTSVTGGNGLNVMANYSYTWTGPSGFTPPVLTTVTALTSLSAGTYVLTVTDAKGCANTFNEIITQSAHREEPGTGAIIVGSDAIKVYPNPTKGQFNVEIPLEFSEAEIKIIDMTGRVMETRVVTDNGGQALLFNLGNVPTGMYLVNVVAGGQNHITKLVME